MSNVYQSSPATVRAYADLIERVAACAWWVADIAVHTPRPWHDDPDRWTYRHNVYKRLMLSPKWNELDALLKAIDAMPAATVADDLGIANANVGGPDRLDLDVWRGSDRTAHDAVLSVARHIHESLSRVVAAGSSSIDDAMLDHDCAMAINVIRDHKMKRVSMLTPHLKRERQNLLAQLASKSAEDHPSEAINGFKDRLARIIHHSPRASRLRVV